MLSTETIQTKILLYRRHANDKQTIFDCKPIIGEVFQEFDETWARPRGEENHHLKRRESQIPTGAFYTYVGRHADYASSVDTENPGDVFIYHPEDFSVLHLRLVQ